MSGWRTLIATSWMPRCHFDAGDDDGDDDVDDYGGGDDDQSSDDVEYNEKDTDDGNHYGGN